MAARETTCYIATCDDCGDEYENGEFTPHWPSAAEAADDAANNGDWWHGQDALLCDTCLLKPHEFVGSMYYADDCDRCENPRDEHETPGGAQ
jgi:hypothetical protein